ncbi:MAG: DUF3127 domain-containing protein [Paludibacter sp.]|jgi:hypothetical protein|nr:DUF3127 domain-containing protein [Paludibacter sp.]
MQLTAKLTQVLPLQTGNGRNGEWKKQDIIVETDGQYPKKVCVSIWGDKINPQHLQPGTTLKIDFDVESREFNGRWYTDVKAWKVEAENAEGSSPGMIPPPPVPPVPDFDDGGSVPSDLPF